MNFQAYLIDGLSRWNAARAQSALDTDAHTLRTFDIRLQNRANQLSLLVHKKPIFPMFHTPGKYTGELIGMCLLSL